MAKRKPRVSEQKGGRLLPRAPLERLIRRAGADRVGISASEALAEVLEEQGLAIAARASVIARHAGRKTVTASDIEMAKA